MDRGGGLQVAGARAWAGDLAGVDELAARLRTAGPNLLQAVDHQTTIAQLRLVGGHLDEAEARCRSALAELESQLRHSPDLAVLPRSVRIVLLERGDVAAAHDQFEAVVEVASPTRRPATVLALLGLSRIRRYGARSMLRSPRSTTAGTSRATPRARRRWSWHFEVSRARPGGR